MSTRNVPSLQQIEIEPVLRFLDRKDWNSLVECSKEFYEAAKLLLPPWPKNCRILQSAFIVRPVWSADGKLIAMGDDDKVRLCHQKHGLLPGFMPQPCPRGGSIVALAFSPNARVLAVASHGTVRVWTNLETNSGNYRLLREWDISKEVEPHEGTCVVPAIHGIQTTPCGQQLVVVLPQKTLLKDIHHTGITTRSMVLPSGVIKYLSRAGCDIFFSRDGLSVLLSVDAGIKRWMPSEPGCLTDQWVNSSRWNCAYAYDNVMAMSHDGSRLAAASYMDGTVWLFMVDKRGELTLKATLPLYTNKIAVKFTPDGSHVVVVGKCQTASRLVFNFWRFQDATLAKTIVIDEPLPGEVVDVSFSPDGQQFVLMVRTEEPYSCSGYYEIATLK